MAFSLLTKEHPIMNSGYAWLVPEGNLHCDSDQSGGDVDSMYRFDELVAAGIVKSLRERGFRWSLRATGNVVIDVLDREGGERPANKDDEGKRPPQSVGPCEEDGGDAA